MFPIERDHLSFLADFVSSPSSVDATFQDNAGSENTLSPPADDHSIRSNPQNLGHSHSLLTSDEDVSSHYKFDVSYANNAFENNNNNSMIRSL